MSRNRQESPYCLEEPRGISFFAFETENPGERLTPRPWFCKPKVGGSIPSPGTIRHPIPFPSGTSRLRQRLTYASSRIGAASSRTSSSPAKFRCRSAIERPRA